MAEFVGSSALFPILDGIRSISESGWQVYLQESAHYVLLIACLIQAWYLGSYYQASWFKKVLGNLIGVSLYTVVEVALEGTHFFAEPYHWVFWGYSLTLAVLSGWQRLGKVPSILPAVFLNLARVSLLPAIYFVIEIGQQTTVFSLSAKVFSDFMSSTAHQFVVYGILFFGLLMGLAEAQILDYAAFLRHAARRLKKYSEWSLESRLIDSSFHNPNAMSLQRVQRTVLFMDIRGFTAWAEKTDPARVVQILNRYYNLAEEIIHQFQGHKPGFAADEVMTRFADPEQAVAAARALQRKIGLFLAPFDLAVGIGLNTGEAMEGLLGSDTTKQFDIIGDAVNTAKRLESAAGLGEILVSAETRAALPVHIRVGPARYLALKGKAQAVAAFPILVSASVPN
ncbi:MAG: adenylate/guanylate cyclase domain-containing protein [Anaerolineae bacterium]